jgi:hypothetical protein
VQNVIQGHYFFTMLFMMPTQALAKQQKQWTHKKFVKWRKSHVYGDMWWNCSLLLLLDVETSSRFRKWQIPYFWFPSWPIGTKIEPCWCASSLNLNQCCL